MGETCKQCGQDKDLCGCGAKDRRQGPRDRRAWPRRNKDGRRAADRRLAPRSAR